MPAMLACAEPTRENNEDAGVKERTRGAQPPAPLAHEHTPASELHPVLQRNSRAINLFNTDDSAPARALLNSRLPGQVAAGVAAAQIGAHEH
jgi:hypothetical protein